MTQLKGDGETHPLLSPTDEFADYETMGSFTAAPAKGDKAAGEPKEQSKGPSAQQDPVALAAQSYIRSALKLGLGQEAQLGVNPFKFGMIGSTDSHNALTIANEANFWGSNGLSEPSPYRAERKQRRRFVARDSSCSQVLVHVLLRLVVRRHHIAPPALLVQPKIRPLALRVVVAYAQSHGSRHPRRSCRA